MNNRDAEGGRSDMQTGPDDVEVKEEGAKVGNRVPDAEPTDTVAYI